MSKTYTEAQAVEAVVAALLFNDLDVAKAAANGEGQELRGRYEHTFLVDDGTRDLLAKAYRIASVHGVGFGMHTGQPLTTRDLRRAMVDIGYGIGSGTED